MDYLAHDTVNDIAIILTHDAYWVRYGLNQHEYDTREDAIAAFGDCLQHAIRTSVSFDVEEAITAPTAPRARVVLERTTDKRYRGRFGNEKTADYLTRHAAMAAAMRKWGKYLD